MGKFDVYNFNGQMVYENENLIYWYKGVVAVPPLCMVDDMLAVQNALTNL